MSNVLLWPIFPDMRENITVPTAMITPEGTKDTHMGFNIFHMTKTFYIRFLHMQSVSVWLLGNLICCRHSNIRCVQIYWCWYGFNWSTVRKVTVVTSTSCHSTRRPHRDHRHPGQPHHAHNTLLISQYGARIITYFSVVKLWFTLRASASAEAPESPISFPSRLWRKVHVLQN